MNPSCLEESEIHRLLSAIPHWHRNGSEICRTFQFSDFKEAMQFVNHVADLAEKSAHHPDITIRWNRVMLALSTHRLKGLTQADFDLASEIDTLPIGS